MKEKIVVTDCGKRVTEWVIIDDEWGKKAAIGIL